MNKKVVLVSGCAGFIGYHTVKRFIEAGETVVGFDNLNDYYSVQLKKDRLLDLGVKFKDQDNLELISNDNNSFTFFKGDLEDDNVWELLQSKFNVVAVIHLAAQAGVRYSIENPKAYINSNVLGFLNLLEFCRRNSLKKLIYASSSSVYGMNSKQPFSEEESCDKPASLYAATKKSNELLAHTYFNLYGIESIGLRFFTVYGPWGRPDMAPFLFTKAAFEGELIKVFNNGNQSRDFTYIDDIVNGIYSVYGRQEKVKKAMIANIGNGQPVALMDFIGAIEKAVNKRLDKKYLPAQPGDVKETFANTQKLKQMFGYQPVTTIEAGVLQFVNWYKNYFNL